MLLAGIVGNIAWSWLINSHLCTDDYHEQVLWYTGLLVKICKATLIEWR